MFAAAYFPDAYFPSAFFPSGEDDGRAKTHVTHRARDWQMVREMFPTRPLAHVEAAAVAITKAKRSSAVEVEEFDEEMMMLVLATMELT